MGPGVTGDTQKEGGEPADIVVFLKDVPSGPTVTFGDPRSEPEGRAEGRPWKAEKSQCQAAGAGPAGPRVAASEGRCAGAGQLRLRRHQV